MTAKLFCKFGPLKGAHFDIDREASIGRNGDNAIVLDNGSVSGKHARIRYDEKQKRYMLEDLDSLNGTRLDGVPVSGEEPLDHLNLITFVNDLNFIFQDLERCHVRNKQGPRPADRMPPEAAHAAAANPDGRTPDGRTPDGRTPDGRTPDSPNTDDQLGPAAEQPPKHPTLDEQAPAILPAALRERSGKAPKKEKKRKHQTQIGAELPVLPGNLAEIKRKPAQPKPAKQAVSSNQAASQSGASGFSLVLTNWEGSGPVKYPLASGSNVIGRGLDSDIAIQSNEISRKHAILTVTDGKVFVEDAGSTNKTFIGRKVVNERTVVPLNKRLFFGKVECSIQQEPAS